MSDVTARLGRRVDIPKSVVSRYANEAYLKVVDLVRPISNERIAVSSTTSGENRYELPADFLEPIQMSWLTNLGSARTLRQISPERVDATGFKPVGQPAEYVLYGNWIELYPSPDSAYSLQFRYRSYATDLINSADVPSVGTVWRFPIVLKTEAYLHGWLGNPEQKARAENDYAKEIATLETDRARRQRDPTAMKVRVIW